MSFVTHEEFNTALKEITQVFVRLEERINVNMQKNLRIFAYEFNENLENKLKETVADIKEHIEVRLKETAFQINEQTSRNIGALTEDYQSKLQVVGEGVQTTWDKCVRDSIEFRDTDSDLARRIEIIESAIVLPRVSNTKGRSVVGKVSVKMKRKHTGKGQDKRKN